MKRISSIFFLTILISWFFLPIPTGNWEYDGEFSEEITLDYLENVTYRFYMDIEKKLTIVFEVGPPILDTVARRVTFFILSSSDYEHWMNGTSQGLEYYCQQEGVASWSGSFEPPRYNNWCFTFSNDFPMNKTVAFTFTHFIWVEDPSYPFRVILSTIGLTIIIVATITLVFIVRHKSHTKTIIRE